MARIITPQTALTYNQTATQYGNYYPCCIYSNDVFMQKYEDALIIAKTVIEPDTEQSLFIDNTLSGLSDYKVWKKKKESDAPSEITEHFGLLPDSDSLIQMPFKAVNNVPTEILLYSYDEINKITETLKTSCEILEQENDSERIEIVKPISESFDNFLTSWNEHINRTGSQFAENQIVE